MTTTETVKTFEALRRSGVLPRNTQQRADEISRLTSLANERDPERYDGCIRRMQNFIETARELGWL